ncbi:MAG: sigma-70 family RNA polymerase sigma factor [Verrucomicrobiota bacterium]
MTELTDHELLARFASRREEKAFRALVDRHLPAVWAVAQSRTGDAEAARDLAQEAFTLLARKAGRLRTEAVVSGWLFLTVRNLASKWLRSNVRRRQREFVYITDPAMESASISSDPALLKRILIPALDELPATERDMVLGRYFENRTCREIAGAVGSTEEAVRKRTGRALEKLRLILARRGFASSAAALGGAITTFAATAPPAGLVQAITAASITAASGTAVLTGVSAIFAMAKTAKALAAAAVTATAAAGITAYVAFRPSRGPSVSSAESRSAEDQAPAAGAAGPDAVLPPAAMAAAGGPDDGPELNINREGLDPGELRSAEGMAEYLFKVHKDLGTSMPREQIQKISLEDARKEMKPLRAFLPLSPESAEAMERIMTARASKYLTDIYWNDHDMVDLLRANKAQFIEAMALKLMNGKPQFGDTNPELDRRSASWTPGVKEAAVKFLKSYVALAKRSRNVMDDRDWAEDESTLSGMRGALPAEQAEAFERFVAERQAIVREGRALTRSQQLAESLQLNASQRQAVFEELLKNNREDKAGMETLFNDAQRAVYQK